METLTSKELALLLGVTPKAISHYKARLPLVEPEDFFYEGGAIRWTAQGVDTVATRVNTSEAFTYRNSRGLALIEGELVEDTPPTPRSLPDPEALGVTLARANREQWVERVAIAYHEELTFGLADELGKKLGLPVELTRESLQ